MATYASILAQKNPTDLGAWQATVHGVAKSWTRLNDFTSFHNNKSKEKQVKETVSNTESKSASLLQQFPMSNSIPQSCGKAGDGYSASSDGSFWKCPPLVLFQMLRFASFLFLFWKVSILHL